MRGSPPTEASLALNDRICELRCQGLSIKEIAQLTGETFACVKTRVQRLHIDTDAWRATNRNRIVVHRLWRKGKCLNEISEALGVSWLTVSNLVAEIATKQEIEARALQVRIEAHRIPDETRAKIRKFQAEGRTQYEIAGKLGMPRSTVGEILQREVGPKYKKNIYPASLREEAVRLYAQGSSSLMVSEKLGMTPQIVLYFARQAGVVRTRDEARVLRYARGNT